MYFQLKYSKYLLIQKVNENLFIKTLLQFFIGRVGDTSSDHIEIILDQSRMENLTKVRTELEVCYEKERQEILANLETELDERKKELLELRSQEMGKLENEHERDLGEE